MNRTRTTIPAPLVLILSMGLTSCSEVFGPKEKEGTNHVCLLDISGSAKENLDLFVGDLRAKLLTQLGPHDALTVLAIDEASLTAAIPLFQVDMAAMEFENSAFPVNIRGRMAAQARAAFLDSVARSFEGIVRTRVALRTASNQKTDILGGLRQAADYARPERWNRLHLLCDMLNESKELNLPALLEEGADLKQAVVALPTLPMPYDQVCVFTGDNARKEKSNTGIEADDFLALQSFWKGYFQKCGVPLGIYTSGGVREEKVSLVQNN